MSSWDLTEIYKDIDDQKILRDIESIQKNKKRVSNFHFNAGSSLEVKKILNLYTQILSKLLRIESYFTLLYFKKNNDDKIKSLYINITSQVKEVKKELENIKYEIANKSHSGIFLRKLPNHYKNWLKIANNTQININEKKYIILYDDEIKKKHIRNKHIFTHILNEYHHFFNTEALKINMNNGFEYICHKNNIPKNFSENLTNTSIKLYESKFIQDLEKKVSQEPFLIHYTHEQAVDMSKSIILSCLESFSMSFKQKASYFFFNKKIDFFPDQFKESGAFCYQTAPSLHPYILLNLKKENWLQDTFILMHELGHGIHQTFSKQRGVLDYLIDPSVNEINSIFCELLLFDFLINNTNNFNKKVILSFIWRRIKNLFFKQAFYHKFEVDVCLSRAHCILRDEDIEKIWQRTQKNVLGQCSADNKYEWIFIPHFFKHPFYIQCYPICFYIAIKLFQIYKSNINQDFVQKYTKLLSKGSALSINEILKHFSMKVREDNISRDVVIFIENIFR